MSTLDGETEEEVSIDVSDKALIHVKDKNGKIVETKEIDPADYKAEKKEAKKQGNSVEVVGGTYKPTEYTQDATTGAKWVSKSTITVYEGSAQIADPKNVGQIKRRIFAHESAHGNGPDAVPEHKLPRGILPTH